MCQIILWTHETVAAFELDDPDDERKLTAKRLTLVIGEGFLSV